MGKSCFYTVVIISILLLCGCEKYIDFGGKEPAPKMVVNAVINARSDTNLIKISESVFDFSAQKPGIVENPEIRLSINGKECNQIWLDTVIGVHSYYKFASKLNAGDKIEFSAHTQRHGTATGYDIVPDTVEIKNIDHAWFYKDGKGYLRLYVTLKDNPQERNFYRIVVKTKTDITHPSIQEPLQYWDLEKVFIDGEMLFHNPTETEEDGKAPNYYRIFPDDMIQGKEYILNIYIEESNYADSDWNNYVRQRVKVEIHTPSEKLYQNLNSQESATGPSGDVFSEPVKIYTNMQGGYGILGVYNVTGKEKLVAIKGE
ncbi:MAG: DUF4249 domain-containing protein [Dysgonamonadaceae bacterium]|jgi:hypothetical protein|nr:DUF4249 domain-containing protein [Dysgonamonadaceae bacterium]